MQLSRPELSAVRRRRASRDAAITARRCRRPPASSSGDGPHRCTCGTHRRQRTPDAVAVRGGATFAAPTTADAPGSRRPAVTTTMGCTESTAIQRHASVHSLIARSSACMRNTGRARVQCGLPRSGRDRRRAPSSSQPQRHSRANALDADARPVPHLRRCTSNLGDGGTRSPARKRCRQSARHQRAGDGRSRVACTAPAPPPPTHAVRSPTITAPRTSASPAAPPPPSAGDAGAGKLRYLHAEGELARRAWR